MMADFRHKEADRREFRRGLEELVRGHIDGCVTAALASCSSAGDGDEGAASTAGGVLGDGVGSVAVAGAGPGPDQLSARRRRRSNLEGEDLAETSAAARRHSRILSRWVARQAEEMITTIERRNRESELMALARLHTVSMLDASFLRESPPGAAPAVHQAAAERPVVAARASSVLQRWREIEGESVAAARDLRSPVRSPTSNEHRRRLESLSQAVRLDNSDVVRASSDSGYTQQATGRIQGSPAEMEDANEQGSSREQSPDFGGRSDGDRDRVRQIIRGWMSETSVADSSSQISMRSESPRRELLGERERQRVRLVREWVHSASQQRDAQVTRRTERVRDSSITDHDGPQSQDRARSDLPRIRGRQARLDLIMSIARERERELQHLSEYGAVSGFAHRNRIQSLLRGRFLRSVVSTENEMLSSFAARELGQIRQRHRASSLREEFPLRQDSSVTNETIVQPDSSYGDDIIGSRDDTSQSTVSEVLNSTIDQPQDAIVTEVDNVIEANGTIHIRENEQNNTINFRETTIHQETWQEEDVEHDGRHWQQSAEVRFNEWHDGSAEYNQNWQENIDHEWSPDTPDDEDLQDNRLLEAHRDWQENDSQDSEENWEDTPPGQQSFTFARSNRFNPPDDDNVYSMELRELLNRRSVSNLLHSGFRESLDQLIQSYVQRQGSDSFDWELQRTMAGTDIEEEDQRQRTDIPIQGSQDPVTGPVHIPPMPPLPPPPGSQPLWQTHLHHSWGRQNINRSEIEWHIINDLRADMARLQQVVSHMQRMLESCMDMQLELQRAVRQEVSAALNRSVGEQGDCESSGDIAKWDHVRKGICCVCCDSHIDSLLYRCGHMCSCLKCANELVREGGKCPLCRAPIIEVIRAYSIL